MNITEVKQGQTATIVGIREGNDSYRAKILALGLIPGTSFVLKNVAPLGDPAEIFIRGYNLSLRKEEAAILDLVVKEA